MVQVLQIQLEDIAALRKDKETLEHQLNMNGNQKDIDLSQRQVYMLNQLKCHVQLNGNKLGLKKAFNQNLPTPLQVQDYHYTRTLDGKVEQWEMVQESLQFLKQNGLDNEATVDFYKLIGSRNLDNSPENQRLLIYFDDIDMYF